MLSKLRSLDAFGQTLKLNTHEGSPTFNTIPGGLLSILWVALVLMVAYIMFADFLDTSKPVVSVNKIRLTQPLRINFTEHQAGAVYILFDGQKFLTVEEAKRFVTLDGKFFKTTKNDQNVVNQVVNKNMVGCSETDSESAKGLLDAGLSDIDSKVNYTALFYDSIYCPVLGDEHMYIDGDRFNLPFATNSDYIYPCSLPDPSQCASIQELSSLQVGLIQMVKVAKYKEKKEPLELALDADSFFYLDIVSRTKMTLFYKMNYIYDDDNGFIGNKLAHTFMDVNKIGSVAGSRLSLSTHCTKQQIQEGACEPYMEIIMRSGYEKMIIERRYKKFFRTISEVGGFNDLIHITLWAVYFLYNSYAFKRFLKSQLKSQLLRKVNPNSQESNQGEANNHNGRLVAKKRKIDNYKKMVSLLNENLTGLPDVNFLTETNSKAKIFLKMVCSKFPLIMPICDKVYFLKKKEELKEKKTKEVLGNLISFLFKKGKRRGLRQPRRGLVQPRMGSHDHDNKVEEKEGEESDQHKVTVMTTDLRLSTQMLSTNNDEDKMMIKRRIRRPDSIVLDSQTSSRPLMTPKPNPQQSSRFINRFGQSPRRRMINRSQAPMTIRMSPLRRRVKKTQTTFNFKQLLSSKSHEAFNEADEE